MFAVKKSDAEYKEDQIMTTLEESSNSQKKKKKNIVADLSSQKDINNNNNNNDLETQRFKLTIRKQARDLKDNPENEEETKYNKILKEYVELMTQADDFELRNKELNKDVEKLKEEINIKQEELKNMASDNTELNIQLENYIKEIESLEKMDKIKTHKIEDLQKWLDTYFHLCIGLVVMLVSVAASNTFKYSNHMLS